MKHNYDHLQLRALCYTAALAPASHLVPKVTASIAGSGSWIAPLIALPVILIFVLLLSGLMTMRRDGEGLDELILRTGGSGFSSIALILLAAFMIFDGGLLLRTAAGRFTDTIFPSFTRILPFPNSSSGRSGHCRKRNGYPSSWHQ